MQYYVLACDFKNLGCCSILPNVVLFSIIACKEISTDDYSNKSLCHETFQPALLADDHSNLILLSYLVSPISLGSLNSRKVLRSSLYIFLLFRVYLLQD